MVSEPLIRLVLQVLQPGFTLFEHKSLPKFDIKSSITSAQHEQNRTQRKGRFDESEGPFDQFGEMELLYAEVVEAVGSVD